MSSLTASVPISRHSTSETKQRSFFPRLWEKIATLIKQIWHKIVSLFKRKSVLTKEEKTLLGAYKTVKKDQPQWHKDHNFNRTFKMSPFFNRSIKDMDITKREILDLVSGDTKATEEKERADGSLELTAMQKLFFNLVTEITPEINNLIKSQFSRYIEIVKAKGVNSIQHARKTLDTAVGFVWGDFTGFANNLLICCDLSRTASSLATISPERKKYYWRILRWLKEDMASMNPSELKECAARIKHKLINQSDYAKMMLSFETLEVTFTSSSAPVRCTIDDFILYSLNILKEHPDREIESEYKEGSETPLKKDKRPTLRDSHPFETYGTPFNFPLLLDTVNREMITDRLLVSIERQKNELIKIVSDPEVQIDKLLQTIADPIMQYLALRLGDLFENVPITVLFDEVIQACDLHLKAYFDASKSAEALIDKGKKTEEADLKAILEDSNARNKILLHHFSVNEKVCHPYVREIVQSSKPELPTAASLEESLKTVAFYQKIATLLFSFLFPSQFQEVEVETSIESEGKIHAEKRIETQEKDGLILLLEKIKEDDKFKTLLEQIKKRLSWIPYYEKLLDYFKAYGETGLQLIISRNKPVIINFLAELIQNLVEIFIKPDNLKKLLSETILPAVKQLMVQVVANQAFYVTKNLKIVVDSLVKLAIKPDSKKTREEILSSWWLFTKKYCETYFKNFEEISSQEEFNQLMDPVLNELVDKILKGATRKIDKDFVLELLSKKEESIKRTIPETELAIYTNFVESLVTVSKAPWSVDKLCRSFKKTIAEVIMDGLYDLRSSPDRLAKIICNVVKDLFSKKVNTAEPNRTGEIERKELASVEGELDKIANLSYGLARQVSADKTFLLRPVTRGVLGKDCSEMTSTLTNIYQAIFGDVSRTASLVLTCLDRITNAVQTASDKVRNVTAVLPA